MNIKKTKTGLQIEARLAGEYYFIPRSEARKFCNKNGLSWEYVKNAPLGYL